MTNTSTPKKTPTPNRGTDVLQRYKNILSKVSKRRLTDKRTIKKEIRRVYLDGGPPPVDIFLDVSAWDKSDAYTYTVSILLSLVPKAKRLQKLPNGSGMSYDEFMKMFLLSKPSKAKQVMINWTSNYNYRNIQKAKRTQQTPESKRIKTMNDRIEQQFRRAFTRVPKSPRGMPTVQYLYRGIRRSEAESIHTNGVLVDHGYIATSRSRDIARRFVGHAGKIMRISVNEIPQGVPWIWFDCFASPSNIVQKRRNGVFHTPTGEKEVLLPPGKFTKKEPTNSSSDYIDVIYTPA